MYFSYYIYQHILIQAHVVEKVQKYIISHGCQQTDHGLTTWRHNILQFSISTD